MVQGGLVVRKGLGPRLRGEHRGGALSAVRPSFYIPGPNGAGTAGNGSAKPLRTPMALSASESLRVLDGTGFQIGEETSSTVEIA
jgi:hypothetical protein